jgi:hypothetical protein
MGEGSLMHQTPQAGHLELAEFLDRYEVGVVELLNKKQAGMSARKEPTRTVLSNGGQASKRPSIGASSAASCTC